MAARCMLWVTAIMTASVGASIAGRHQQSTLPAPQRLMVEYLPTPADSGPMLVVGTTRPRFSFVPHGTLHPGPGVEMTGYRITVTATTTAAAAAGSAGAALWDSGVVEASAAVSVQCGVDLPRLRGYLWTAQWWGTSPTAIGAAPVASLVATASFEVGPNNSSDWTGSPWVGGHQQNEFRLQFDAGATAAKLFVAAPGGAVVYANGRAVSDESGISAWIKNGANLPYFGYDLRPFCTGGSVTVVVRAGTGFFSDSKWRAGSGGGGAIGAVVRLLAVDATGRRVPGTLSGRAGMVVSSNPFVGGIFDTTLTDDAGWAPASRVLNPSQFGLDGPLRAFAVQPAKTGPVAAAALHSSAISVTALPPAPAPRRCSSQCDPTSSSSARNNTDCATKAPDAGGCDPLTAPQRRWAYAFDRNIVGMAAVNPGAFSVSCGAAAADTNCTGEISLQYCEVFNQSSYTKDRTPGIPWPQWTELCQPLAGLSVVADTFIVGPGSSPSLALRPSFTWHGFQHVIVSVSETVTFEPKLESLTAQWTAINAEPTGMVEFGGGTDSALLNQLIAMTQAGQLSNMAAYVPTDCPTREKHAWLGDALDVAEELAYNFWAPPMYELFLDTIRAEQIVGGPGDGNLPVNVPAGAPGRPMDISWTAAYPLIAHWLHLYYGDLGVVREHWPTLKRYVDGQRRQMGGGGGGAEPNVPDFWNFGDWCAIEARNICTPNTGPPAAAANFILAVEAMASMAGALGEDADEAKYTSWLAAYRVAFDAKYWSANLTSYGKTTLELQTMSSVALGAGVVPSQKVPAVRSALVADIGARGTHLTVGATGQKWLLRTLSAGSAAEHDVALALASQRTFPSWGSWIERGATTCWEDWVGIQDPSHPGNDVHPINPPTHNHIFLCGGLGEWMFRSVGGIAPASPGYGTVAIAPRISATRDPVAVNSTVQTVRGQVSSNWTRHDAASCVDGRTALLTLRISVPVGMRGVVYVPFLEHSVSAALVEEVKLGAGDGTKSPTMTHVLWPPTDSDAKGPDSRPVWLRATPRIERGMVVLEMKAAELQLRVSITC